MKSNPLEIRAEYFKMN